MEARELHRERDMGPIPYRPNKIGIKQDFSNAAIVFTID